MNGIVAPCAGAMTNAVRLFYVQGYAKDDAGSRYIENDAAAAAFIHVQIAIACLQRPRCVHSVAEQARPLVFEFRASPPPPDVTQNVDHDLLGNCCLNSSSHQGIHEVL